MNNQAKKQITELRKRLDKLEYMIDNNQHGADVVAMFVQRTSERIVNHLKMNAFKHNLKRV